MGTVIFSAETHPGQPAQLKNLLLGKLSEDIAKAISLAEKSIGVSLKRLIELSQQISRIGAPDPDVFAAHWYLVEALKTSDSESIKAALATLVRVLSTSGTVGQFRVRSISETKPSDSAMLDYIFGADGAKGREGEDPILDAVSDQGLNFEHTVVAEAITKLRRHSAGIFDEFVTYASSLALFNGRVITGATSMRAFGNILLRVPHDDVTGEERVAYYLEHIVHETSHLNLHCLMIHDPMVLNPLSQTFTAPIRHDKRPMFGIFHAAYVLSRMVSVFDHVASHGGGEIYFRLYDEFLRKFKLGVSTVSQHANLTPAGNQVLSSLNDKLTSFQ